ncbi:MAG TPA: sugar ABC transporter permease [Armatimonadota bacterium]|jgi:multiple sugar transport system permease protein
MAAPAVALERKRKAPGMKPGRFRDVLECYLFLVPYLLLFSVFVIGPVTYGFYISLHDYHVLSTHRPFVGFANYAGALHDDLFLKSLINTAYFAVMVVPLGNLISLLLALGICKEGRLTTFFRSAFYLPVVISVAVVAVLWQWLYSTQWGLINYYLDAGAEALRQLPLLGAHIPAYTPIPWLSSPRFAMASIALLSMWWGAGGNMIVYLAGLQAIPETYYEAATLDGANSWQRFWSVTWPQLRPTLLFCLVLSVIGAFQVFGQVMVLTRGGPDFSTYTMVLYLYLTGFSLYKMGYACAVAYLLFLVVLVFTLLQFRLLSFKEVD